MTNDDDREALRDELAGWVIGAGYYQSMVGTSDAAEMADAILAAGFRRLGPITDEVVEAAARALAETFGEPPYLPWEGWGELSRDEFRADARAALEAAERARSAAPSPRPEPTEQESVEGGAKLPQNPEPTDPVRCGEDVQGTVPSLVGSGRIDPCSCVRPAGHEPPCVCAHGEPDDMVPEPTKQEQ